MRQQSWAGFTLIEIMVVVVIVAMVTAIIIPVFTNYQRFNRQSKCFSNLHAISVALTEFHDDFQAYPSAPLPNYLRSYGTDTEAARLAMPLGYGLPWGSSGIDYAGATGQNDLLRINFTGSEYRACSVSTPIPGQFRCEFWNSLGAFCSGETYTGPLTTATASVATAGGLLDIRFGGTTHDIGDIWRFPAYPVPRAAGTTMAIWQQADDAAASVLSDPIDASVKPTAFTVDDPTVLGEGDVAVIAEGTPAEEYVRVMKVVGNTITARGPLTKNHASGDPITNAGYTSTAVTDPRDVPTRQYGLATLFKLYLEDRKDYLKSYQTFHCPQVISTETVNRDANLSALTLDTGKDQRPFDPLWSGYNTYDITYNYDQFYNDILEYDTRLGTLGEDGNTPENLKRQLCQPNPPADTVVLWCYAHNGTSPDAAAMQFKPVFPPDTKTTSEPLTWDWMNPLQPRNPYDLDYADPDPFTPPSIKCPGWTPEPAPAREKDNILRVESTRYSETNVVLWLDGSVEMRRPVLAQSRLDPNIKYWVPIYLLGRH